MLFLILKDFYLWHIYSTIYRTIRESKTTWHSLAHNEPCNCITQFDASLGKLLSDYTLPSH